MGHIRTGPLPATRKWNEVVAFIENGADAAQLATATLDAAEQGLKAAANDPGVLESLWLLVRIPLAARADDFADMLRACDLGVGNDPSLLDISLAYTAAVDARMPNCKGRTDLGEMAQTAGVEAINATAGPRAESLWGTGPTEVKAGFAALATVKQFGILARGFFSRFTFKALNYFLSKATPDQIGEGKRFRTVADHGRFADALQTHCHEATFIVERFAGEWFSKHKHLTASAITRKQTSGFLGYCVTKLTREFRNREGGRGH